jgi:hypothetical protein
MNFQGANKYAMVQNVGYKPAKTHKQLHANSQGFVLCPLLLILCTPCITATTGSEHANHLYVNVPVPCGPTKRGGSSVITV